MRRDPAAQDDRDGGCHGEGSAISGEQYTRRRETGEYRARCVYGPRSRSSTMPFMQPGLPSPVVHDAESDGKDGKTDYYSHIGVRGQPVSATPCLGEPPRAEAKPLGTEL